MKSKELTNHLPYKKKSSLNLQAALSKSYYSIHRHKTMAFHLILISTLVLLLTAYKLYQRLRFKLPPGPHPWPVVGNLYDIKPVRFRCFAEWGQAYGPIISVWFGSKLAVVVSTSALAKEVLKEHDQQLADRHRSRLAAKSSKNGKNLIWADYGPYYVKVRKVCTLVLFTAKSLEALRPIREDEVMAMVESIFKDCTNPENKGKSLSVRSYLGAVALNNITRLVLGKRFTNEEGVIDEQGMEFRGIVTNGSKLAAGLNLGDFVPWLQWMYPSLEEDYLKHCARRDRLAKAIIEEHKLKLKHGGGTEQHFVDALLNAQDQYELSDDSLIGLLWDMITAGMDTTAVSVEWAMAEIIKNPRVQQKAQEELDRVVGSDRVMNETDFANLPYLQHVAKEAMRLHPPTPLMLPHRASTHVKIGSYDIPKDCIVYVNVWAIGRDPAVWKDPHEFRPERFLEEDVDMKGHDYRLLPFGAGRRICPATQLGINLVTSMLGHLLHQFTWNTPAGMKPNEIDMAENPGTVTYMRTPLQAVATPRLPSHLYKRVVV